MAVTEETLKLLDGRRIYLSNLLDEQTRDLVRSWVRAWDSLESDWRAAVADIIEGRTAWPSQTALRQSRRTLIALSRTEEALQKLVSDGAIRITGDARKATDVRRIEAMMIASQMPQDPGRSLVSMAIRFDRVDPLALDAIVNRTTQRVTSLASRIDSETYSRMLNDLVRGVAIGDNPLRAARTMMGRMESGFNYGLHRMNIISRTEMLDASRAASLAQRKANDDVLKGWTWFAQLDERTCPGCLSMHGQEFGNEQAGPDDHQQGRCSALPITRTWQELGFDIEEPESAITDAQEWFNSLPQGTKLEIMGPARLEALSSGKAEWRDLSTYVTNPDWRGSYHPTPVSALLSGA